MTLPTEPSAPKGVQVHRPERSGAAFARNQWLLPLLSVICFSSLVLADLVLSREGCSEVGGSAATQRYQRCPEELAFRFLPFEQRSNAPSLASRRLLFPLLCSAALFAVAVVCRHCGRLAKQRSSQKWGAATAAGFGRLGFRGRAWVFAGSRWRRRLAWRSRGSTRGAAWRTPAPTS